MAGLGLPGTAAIQSAKSEHLGTRDHIRYRETPISPAARPSTKAWISAKTPEARLAGTPQ
ncbi:hypothetical protein EMIT0194MI4_40494 [Pseudomonas sp. IT-194MI4]